VISYVLRRLLSLVPVLWAVVTIIWVCVFLLPGDPASLLAGGQRSDPRVIARIRSEWGLDDPAAEQYLRYLARLARGDLGTSYLQGRPVARVIGEAFPPTAFLAVSAMLLASVGGIGLGLLCAAHARRWLDDLLTFLSLVFVSLPAFWLGLMLILLFASRLGWLPVLGYGMEGLRIPKTGIRLPELRHLVLPAFTLGLISMGTVARITRAALLDVLGSDFIRSSAARGNAPTALYLRHALRNALIPVVTVIGVDFAALLGGAVATEFVFAWPGLGKAIVRGIADRDLPLVEGGVLCLSLAFVLVNLAVDLCYLAVDPRVRLRNS
jgi:ABC-type dipeptide/oligopeptide/nickel transport system permease component